MKNTQKLSVTFRLNHQRAKKGEAPIYVKMYLDGKPSEMASGYFINPKFWNNDQSEVRNTHPEYIHYNTKLADIKSELTREFLMLTATSPQITLLELKKKYLKLDDKPIYKTVCEAFDYHNVKVEQLVKAGKLSDETLLRYKITKNKIVEFMKVTYQVSDKSLNDLKYSFVTDLEHYFLTNQKLHNNTTYKYIKNFKKVITMAVNNDWMVKNPFMQFKSQYHWKDREVLTQEEIDLIINKEFSSLIELIYALQSHGAFGSQTDIKEIAAYFENAFNIDLGDYYRTYLEIRIRKTGRTKFLASLKESLTLYSYCQRHLCCDRFEGCLYLYL